MSRRYRKHGAATAMTVAVLGVALRIQQDLAPINPAHVSAGTTPATGPFR